MSVRLSNHNLSRFEVSVLPDEIHDMLIELMQRKFGKSIIVDCKKLVINERNES